MQSPPNNFEKAISLLDQATQIDTSYYLAYENKLMIQLQLKQFDKALATSNNLLRINPQIPGSYITVGILYEKNGDSITSRKYFEDAATKFDKILDTMTSSNPHYDLTVMNKAINLILMDKQQQGNGILQQLYEKQKDEIHKELYRRFLNKSRPEILNTFFTPDTTASEAWPTIKN
jgi:tetratricopeptide (TPR) repeat protein